jgi:predicted Zn-dependent protease
LTAPPPAYPLQGGDRTKEAGALFRELNDRFGASVAGVNGLAAVYIAQRRYGDAERVLEELLESHPAQPDALINLNAVYAHTGRAEAAGKWIDALRAAAPGHPFLQQQAQLEAAFDRVAATFAV